MVYDAEENLRMSRENFPAHFCGDYSCGVGRRWRKILFCNEKEFIIISMFIVVYIKKRG